MRFIFICWVILIFLVNSCNSNDLAAAVSLPMVIYSSVQQNGNFTDRATADGICLANIPGGLEQANVRALISFNATDEIRDFEVNYGIRTDVSIVSPTADTLADDWDELLTTGLQVTLQSVGIGLAHVEWWSGSNADGSLSANTCTSWTDGFAGNGMTGRTDNAASWLAGGLNDPCAANKYLLCLAF